MVKRSEKLKAFVNECSFDVLTNPKHMDTVDLQSMPKTMAELFYDAGDGDYPEDQEAYFEPPTQDAFALAVFYYCQEHSEHDEKFTSETKAAWIQRCKKTWASLVRDVHFAFMMMEEQEQNDTFDLVRYSVQEDIENGADLIINDAGQEYHINLFIDSQKSRKFMEQKKKYRQQEKMAIDVEVPMTFSGEKQSVRTNGDDIWLYSSNHVQAINRIITGGQSHVTQNGTTLAKIRNPVDLSDIKSGTTL